MLTTYLFKYITKDQNLGTVIMNNVNFPYRRNWRDFSMCRFVTGYTYPPAVDTACPDFIFCIHMYFASLTLYSPAQ